MLRFLRNQSLYRKLVLFLNLLIIILLVPIFTLLRGVSVEAAGLNGQARVLDESVLIQAHFADLESEVLAGAKDVATADALVAAAANGDVQVLHTVVLIAAGSRDLDELIVFDTNGVPLTSLTSDSVGVSADEKALSGLGLLGIEVTGLVVRDDGFLLAATAPVRDLSGQIVGAILVGRQVNNDFLTELNFNRENVQISLVYEGQLIAAQSAAENEQSLDISALVKPESIASALNGQTIVEEDLVYDSNDVPYAIGYVPLVIAEKAVGSFVIQSSLKDIFSFRQQLGLTIAGSFLAVVLFAALLLSLFMRYAIVNPVAQLNTAVQAVGSGNLDAPLPTTSSGDEIGQLTISFRLMTNQLQQSIGELRRRNQVIETTGEISQRLTTILNTSELTTAVVQTLQEVFHYYHVQIYLLDKAKQALVMAGGTGDAGLAMLHKHHQIALGKGLVGQAADTKASVLVANVTKIETWLANPLLPETKSELAVPILVGETVLGVLDVQADQEDGLTVEDVALIESVAATVAFALQNARLYEQVQTRADHEAVVNQINQQILSASTMERVLEIAAQELGQSLGVRQTTVQLSGLSKANGRTQEKADAR